MPIAGRVLDALLAGGRLALEFNPLAAVITVAVAAAFATAKGKRRAADGRWLVVALAGWLIGDGLRVFGRARDLADGVWAFAPTGSEAWYGWVVLAIWALGTLAVGYLLPTLVGASVGRRVTLGTGWLAASAIGVAFVSALVAGIGALA
jgi:hypothetical protein